MDTIDAKADEGTFLTSIKGGKNNMSMKRSQSSIILEHEHQALVLFKHNRDEKSNKKSSSTAIDDLKFKEPIKPPMYLPELRKRKDVWKGQTSTEMVNENKPGRKKHKKTIDAISQLRADKNWFLIPQKNVFLCLTENDYNEELKQLSKKK